MKTLFDIYKAIDSGSSTLLVVLDLSAAFDTVPHDNLLQRLHHSFDITVLPFLKDSIRFFIWSQLSNCTSFVWCPTRFGTWSRTSYKSPVSRLVASFGLLQQQYADDTQIYITVNKTNHTTCFVCIESCTPALLDFVYGTLKMAFA